MASDIRDGDWSRAVQTARQLRDEALSLAQACARGAPGSTDGEPPKCYLVTGAAGFIGSHVARRLLELGNRVIAVDEFNDYYDPVLKWENVADLLSHQGFELYQADVRDKTRLRDLATAQRFDAIIHLAARAGVRPSLTDPDLYVTTNVVGTQNMLDLAREWHVTHFVYASSSSVYGGSTDFPFSETQRIESPLSPYAVTKKANELQAACYSQLYGMKVSGLRFFTVYGPSGRPDMAVRMFIERLSRGEPVPLFGSGRFERDYTYIDDIVDGIMRVLATAERAAPWSEVFNLGESDTTSVLQLILMIAKELGRTAFSGEVKELSLAEQEQSIDDLTARGLVSRLPAQLGDVPKTHADISKAREVLGYCPGVGVQEGIRRTIRWHLEQQRKAFEPQHQCIRRALRLSCSILARAGLDSSGKRKTPRYVPGDADALLCALADLNEHQLGLASEPLALRTQLELACAVQEVTSHLAQS